MNKYHYVYRITNKESNKHYYGCRSSKVEPKLDLGIKYFSSSTDKEFINEQKVNTSIFKYKVIKTFETREEAINLEIKLHLKFEVGKSESFYNKSKQTSNKFDTTSKVSYKDIRDNTRGSITVEEFYNNEFYVGVSSGISKDNYGKNNPMFGKKHTEETKLNIGLKSIGRQTFKGKEHSGESKRKISESRLLLFKNSEFCDKMKKVNLKQILIYDDNDNLIYTSDCNFSEFCKKNNLPQGAFTSSYKNNIKLYQNNRHSDENRLINNGNIKFKGWYAIKMS